MSTADWIQTFALIVALFALLISIFFNRKQLKIFNDQLRLNFFADYTKRYQEIVLNFPEDINQPDFDYGKLSDEVRNKTLRYMRVYFDLCSEELHLWKNGNIENETWKNWQEGIEFAFSKKAFRDAWKIIKLDTIYYPDFSKWVTEITSKYEVTENTISE